MRNILTRLINLLDPPSRYKEWRVVESDTPKQAVTGETLPDDWVAKRIVNGQVQFRKLTDAERETAYLDWCVGSRYPSA